MLTLLAALGSLILSGMAAAPARAELAQPTITETTVQTHELIWGQDRLVDGTVDPNINLRTVSGTSQGTTGDEVKIVCESVDNRKSIELASGVPVNADGTFDATVDLEPLFNLGLYLSCKMSAVWSTDTATNHTQHQGMLVQPVLVSLSRTDGVNSFFFAQVSGDDALYDLMPTTICPVCDSYWPDETGWAYSASGTLFYYNGDTGHDDREGLETADIIVDGKFAFLPMAVASRTSIGLPDAQRTTELSFTLDAETGEFTVVEEAPLLQCRGVDEDARAESCYGAEKSYLYAGVTFRRTSTITGDGIAYLIEDELISTDGDAHSVKMSFHEAPKSGSSWKYQAGLTGVDDQWHADFDGSATNSTAGVFEVDLARDPAAPIAANNPYGKIMYYPEVSLVEKLAETARRFTVVDQQVPAAGSTSIAHAYAAAGSEEAMARGAAQLWDFIEPFLPAQTITWAPATDVLTTDTAPSALAVSDKESAITYSVVDAGTTGCTIDPATAALAFTAAGQCTVAAAAAGSRTYRSARAEVVFNVALPVEPPPAPKCEALALGEVKFPYLRARIVPTTAKKLRVMAAKMIARGCTSATITGYTGKTTSKSGSAAMRKSLALARAHAVSRFLRKEYAKSGLYLKTYAKAVIRVDSSPNDRGRAEAWSNARARITANGGRR